MCLKAVQLVKPRDYVKLFIWCFNFTRGEILFSVQKMCEFDAVVKDELAFAEERGIYAVK